ncbi:hydantoinase/oxoprolinase family protein [Aminobacter sp. MET-1]|uniref:hydantoinase/oxoprolinase family protein n=1 Tax=Aminobacter sp. MET-1 TaxID=2951085 RepID=UPI00226A9AFC|nr:hydantoinase/oxoprolinase family protein [Aminobacter sp. MET-1]MCX8572108.1 hydantoinase/oxoprolinase family protein [Aminobacter sp. MET-1]
MQIVGIDTGGTFTDTVILADDGRIGVGKSLTTHGRLMEGVIASLGVAARSLGRNLRDILETTDILSHGTTVGLNALLTGSGARVGLLVTAGFESTLPMARSNKVHGLPDEDSINALKWRKPDLLVSRRRIVGVDERIDVDGRIVQPLDEQQARRAIRQLVSRGAEAIGIALMWSPVNAVHERRLADLVAEEAPGLHVTLSSELAPRIGEYERTATVAMNAYVAPLVGDYLASLEEALRAEGFVGLFLIVTMGGGVRRAKSLRDAPVHLLQSGPVGGIMAARQVGARLGHADVLATDVGGTSFDVGLVVGGTLPNATRPRIDRHSLAVPVIDLASIGTGGGSIAYVDAELGVLRVGPQSAGSMPGPACYGRGGTQPTVTDAAVVLGYLDRLGGALHLDRGAAQAAILALAEHLGMEIEAAAEGILRVANAQMADLVRRASVQRGYDPRNFVLYAYGGAAPQHVGRYAAEIGVKSIVIPRLAPEFSAWGAAASDMRTACEIELPARSLRDFCDIEIEAFDRLEQRARGEFDGLGEAGFSKAVDIRRKVGLKFSRQLHRIDIDVPGACLGPAEIAVAEAAFRARYEQIVGRGAAHAGSTIELAAIVVEARMPISMPEAAKAPRRGVPQPVRSRNAWFHGREQETPVYLWDDLGEGAEIAGPAFIESEQTTAVIHPDQTAATDADGNLTIAVLRRGKAPAQPSIEELA